MAEKTNIDFKHFWCYDCHDYWKTDDYSIEDGVALSKCPLCRNKCHDVPHYFANLHKMHMNATGPRTPEGKNRSSVNGYKTGIKAQKTMILAPANHGKYSQCPDCEYSEQCKNKDLRYCPKILDPMIRFLAAYENGDIGLLKNFAGMSQGKAFLTLQNIFRELFDKGVLIESGNEKYKELKSNPVIKHIPELMSVLGFTSDQQQMNPKNVNNLGDDKQGGLEKIETVGEFMKEFLQKVNQAVDNVRNLKPPVERGDKAAEDKKATVEIPAGPGSNPFSKK